MSTPDALRAFYDQVWRLALTGAALCWCRQTRYRSDHLLVPAWNPVPGAPTTGDWPILPDTEVIGWIPTPEKIEAAFTAVLRTNAPAVEVDPGIRRALHLAEQERDTAKLDATLADVILQVAVFGRVML